MITIHIRELSERNQIANAHQLQQAASLTPGASQRLWRGEWEKISKDTLDRLCAALNCQPGDLFTYSATKTKKRS
jgi:DNA-binding Xre family transcriptional regulator